MFTKKGKCYICKKQKKKCTTVETGTVSGMKTVLMCEKCWNDCVGSISKSDNEQKEK